MATNKNNRILQPSIDYWRDGYLLTVRNRLNNHLQKEFLPEEMKDSFLARWPDQIIFHDDFFDWYCSSRKISG